MNYELTLTLHPRHYSKKPIEQYKLLEQIILSNLAKYQISGVAELTTQENIHGHFMVYLTPEEKSDLCNFLRKDSTKKTIGRLSISAIKNSSTWVEYLKKDLSVTQKIIQTDPIIIDNQRVLYNTVFKVGPLGEIYIATAEKPTETVSEEIVDVGGARGTREGPPRQYRKRLSQGFSSATLN